MKDYLKQAGFVLAVIAAVRVVGPMLKLDPNSGIGNYLPL